MFRKLIREMSNSKIKVFIASYIIYIFIVNQLDLYVIGSDEIIYCINMLLNITAIGAGIIYYKANKNKNIYIFILIYVSMFIENAYFSFSEIYGIYNRLIYPIFVYRTFLLSLIIYNDDIKAKIMLEKSRIFSVLSIIINILLIKFYSEYFMNLNEKASNYILYGSIIVTYFIIVKVIIKVKNNDDFMEMIFLFSILLLGMKLWLIFLIRSSSFLVAWMPSDERLFFIGFSAILVALFVDNNFVNKENQKLNDDVIGMLNDIEKLKEIEKLRTQFFANLSHELKTPINIIYSSIQLLEMKKEMDESDFVNVYKDYDPIFKQNCFRMIRLTNNLVDMTKINAGYLSLDFKNVDIVRLVEEITMSVVQYVENKKINIIFDTLVEEHTIKCNIDAIERIVLNLLSNAIKFSYANAEILVFMELKDGYIVIKVRDYGKGVSKDKRESIFEVFVQEDKSLSREKEGSGIGLSLVKSLVEMHNGIVYLSDVEVGTEVIVKIPDVKFEDDLAEELDLNDADHSIVSKINVEFSDIYNMD